MYPIDLAPKDGTKILAYGLQTWNGEAQDNSKKVWQVVCWREIDLLDDELSGWWEVDTCSFYCETLDAEIYIPITDIIKDELKMVNEEISQYDTWQDRCHDVMTDLGIGSSYSREAMLTAYVNSNGQATPEEAVKAVLNAKSKQ